jgi:dTMP kinase
MTGLFISLEGGEGAGKSTQAQLLVQSLEKAGRCAIATREPGGVETAESIRQLLVTGDHAWLPTTELLLHMAARYEHVHKVIIPSLQKGMDVVCDRYVHSSIAYQGYGHALGQSYVETFHRLALGSLCWPDIAIYLAVSLGEGMQRVQKRNERQEDRYERMQESFHWRVHNSFEHISKTDSNMVTINASLDIAKVHQAIVSELNHRFSLSLKSIH